MWRRLKILLQIPSRFHFFGGLLILLVVAITISGQMSNRRTFADSELHQDVMERWGAPIAQPVPSLRWVESGTVFNALQAMPFERQQILVDAAMNYRKRGLIYFSGFDFSFRGTFEARNHQTRDIDVVFVFPLQRARNQILLADLAFTVNGRDGGRGAPGDGDTLMWTGRLKPDEVATFALFFTGRGLDAFTYRMDPALPAHNVDVQVHITGGDNFDYEDGVVPAHEVSADGDRIDLGWSFASLESGIPVGVVLPSLKSYDELIATMVRRSWATFTLFYAGIIALCLLHGRRLRLHEGYLAAAGYGFFFVLLAYLAAFMDFYLAFGLSLLIIGALLTFYLGLVIAPAARRSVAGLLISFLLVPNVAVIAQGYTGLIYCLEILVGLSALMVLTTRSAFGRVVDDTLASVASEGGSHAH
ncbi:MAG: hypothetical protein ABIJ09_06200 [Pseudomonadota bacterium]